MRLFIFIFMVLLAASCQRSISIDEKNYPLILSFEHAVGNDTMLLGNTYTNAFNEAYTLTGFKYYVSNFSYTLANGQEKKFPVQYCLVDESAPATKKISLTLTDQQISSIAFYIGVDSARNVTGTQSGDLDPAKGMFWTWNSGYIMAKLEGSSPASTAPANSLSLHVGGFRTGENTVRKIQLPLPVGGTTLSENKAVEIVVKADAATWFNAVHNLPIAQHPICHSPGQLAVQFADNYSNMFTLTAVNP